MNTPLAYLNGRFLPFHEAALPLHDAGFVSGATVVDNARTYSQKLFRWADHLERFRHNCEACFVPLETTDVELSEAAEVLVAGNSKLLPPGGELQLVTFATPGPLGFYLGDVENGPPTIGMVTYPVPVARYRPFFSEGAVLVAVPNVVPDAVVPPTVKHRSRMNWYVADRIAREKSGMPHALAVNSIHGTITETSIANLLAVIDGEIVSPPRDTILDGISLKVTRELCLALGLPFREDSILDSQLSKDSELLLTGTGLGIAGVREVHTPECSVSFRWPGPVFRRLQAAWSELTGERQP